MPAAEIYNEDEAGALLRELCGWTSPGQLHKLATLVNGRLMWARVAIVNYAAHRRGEIIDRRNKRRNSK